MLKPTWELDEGERLVLAEHRCEFLFRHIKEKGGAPKRTKSSTTILVPSHDRIFSVSFSPKDPRLVTIALGYSAPAVEQRKAVEAAQLASQSTIVAKVQIEPRAESLEFAVKAELFNDDEDDLANVFGLYLAAVHDTCEHFIGLLAE